MFSKLLDNIMFILVVQNIIGLSMKESSRKPWGDFQLCVVVFYCESKHDVLKYICNCIANSMLSIE